MKNPMVIMLIFVLIGLAVFSILSPGKCKKWEPFSVGNETLGASGRRCVEH